MKNGFFKKSFISLAAASMLATSAFADAPVANDLLSQDGAGNGTNAEMLNTTVDGTTASTDKVT